jgi:hypothetical protein
MLLLPLPVIRPVFVYTIQHLTGHAMCLILLLLLLLLPQLAAKRRKLLLGNPTHNRQRLRYIVLRNSLRATAQHKDVAPVRCSHDAVLATTVPVKRQR